MKFTLYTGSAGKLNYNNMKLILFLLLITATAKGQTINASRFKPTGSSSMNFYTPPLTFDTIKIAKQTPLLANYTKKDSVLTLYVSKDSLIKYLVKYLDYSAIVKYIADSSGANKVSRLQAKIDSLQSKLNKQLEYHYYSCEIISSLRPNGTLVNRRQYHKAIRAYFERYGMVKMKVKASKF